jgi:hypothetical protein
VWQPNNPHDKNAVVIQTASGVRLGHVSRSIAPHYTRLVKQRKIVESDIASIDDKSSPILIKIRGVYEDEAPSKVLQQSRLVASSGKLRAVPGVYTIVNVTNETVYIGSSIDVNARLKQHISALRRGCHANHPLQRDYQAFGPDTFEARLLVETNDYLISKGRMRGVLGGKSYEKAGFHCRKPLLSSPCQGRDGTTNARALLMSTLIRSLCNDGRNTGALLN